MRHEHTLEKCAICKQKIETVDYYKDYQYINDSGNVHTDEGHFKTEAENGVFVTYNQVLPLLSSVGPNGQEINKTFLICNNCQKINYDEKLRSQLLRHMKQHFVVLTKTRRKYIADWQRTIANDEHEIELLEKTDLRNQIDNARCSILSIHKGWLYE